MVELKNGDLLESGCNIICHQCNCLGSMGAGIAKSIKNKWPICYKAIRDDYQNGKAILGDVLFVKVDENTYIANMYAQLHYSPKKGGHTKYNMFDKCCKEVAKFANGFGNCRIGFPYKIGCGLAGGDWGIVSGILEKNFKEYNAEIWKLE